MEPICLTTKGRIAVLLFLSLSLLSACTWPFAASPTPSPVPASATPTSLPTSTASPTPSPTVRIVPSSSPTPSPVPSLTPPPLDEAGFLERGDALWADGDFESALRLYREALARYAGTSSADEARLRIARTYLDMGRPLSTTAALSPVLDQLPDGPRHRAHFLLAEAYREAGGCAQAIPYYQRYREGGTTLEDLVAERLAWCHREMGSHALAAAEFTTAASSYRSLADQVWMLEEAARDLREIGDFQGALDRYERILALARKPWYRATILYQIGEVLEAAGRPDEARARWQEILATYPETEAASWAADGLLAAQVPVDAYAVARAYRAAGRVAASLPWFEEALGQGGGQVEAVRYDLALARAEVGDLEGALAELDRLIASNPADPQLLLEKGRLLGEAGSIARALEVYVLLEQRFTDTLVLGQALWRGGRLLEGQGHDGEAVAAYRTLWERYPEHERALEAHFRAGLIRYQEGDLSEAAALWEASGGDERLALWRGVALAQIGRPEEATRSWERAAGGEGYYAARAGELLSEGPSFGRWTQLPVWGDEADERAEAERWLAEWWGRPFSATLPDAVLADPMFARGEELRSLGCLDEALTPYAFLMERFRYDAPALYALSLQFRAWQAHSLSIRAAWHLLDLADLPLEQAPPFFLRLLYPTPYAHLIVLQAQANEIDPLLFFALVRQESLFDRYATSWADARGLTQVIPSTGQWIAEVLGWTDFHLRDLYRPVVSTRFGAWYLGEQLETFEGQAIPALAAYNGGPGNALRWAGHDLPVGDIDLFVESIDFTETRDYIERIYTSYWLYRRLYAGE